MSDNVPQILRAVAPIKENRGLYYIRDRHDVMGDIDGIALRAARSEAEAVDV